VWQNQEISLHCDWIEGTMNKVRVFAFLAGALMGAAGMRAEVPSAVAIKDARVITVSGAELPKATVLLRNGLIEDVGPNLTVPADAWVIDGNGLTVYPGFFNGLSTWGIPDAAPAAGAGARSAASVTPTPATPAPRVRGPEDRPQNYSYERAADLVKPSDRRLDGARSIGFTTSATFPSRGIFTGLGAVVDLTGERAGNMVVEQPVGQQIVLRAGGFRAGYPGSLMGLFAYVRQMYLDLSQYQQAKQIYSAHTSGTPRPPYDHYLEGLAESPRILLPADQSQQIDRVIAFAKELKQPAVLYGLHEGFARIDELKEANLPLLINLHWPEKPKESDPSDVPSLRDLELRAKAPTLPGLLRKAGVKFALYSDGTDQPADIKKQVKKAIDEGLNRSDAIRALTLSPAEMYGVADRLGSVDKGKIANLVVTKGDVFEEKTTVEYVFIDGELFKPTKLPPAQAGGGARPNMDGHRDDADDLQVSAPNQTEGGNR
jgi:Amidohydrolase family